MRALVLASLVASAPALAAEPAAEYVPAPAKDIPGYSEKVFPCEKVRGWKTVNGEILEADGDHRPDNAPMTFVVCDGEPELQKKSLRELSLLRNTIYARYGWAGFRKDWLREHFQKQPWYKPDPNFSYDRLSYADTQNVELLVLAEMSWRYVDLESSRDKLLASAGKWWGDLPTYYEQGQPHYGCDPRNFPALSARPHSKDCFFHSHEALELDRHQDNKPTPADLDRLSAEDRIELGLLSRAMGEFALDEGQREQAARSLDGILSVTELRQLSLRDLRLLRNTLYARRGRPFKSKVLQEHFAHMPWYKADPAYTDARLTDNDKRNVKLIQSVEKELGGALGDEDFKRKGPSTATDVNIPPDMMVA